MVAVGRRGVSVSRTGRTATTDRTKIDPLNEDNIHGDRNEMNMLSPQTDLSLELSVDFFASEMVPTSVD